MTAGCHQTACTSAVLATALALVVLSVPVHAQVDSGSQQNIDAHAKPELTEDASPELVKIRELGAHFAHQTGLIRALDDDAARAAGADAEALHRAATEIRIGLVDPVQELAQLLMALEGPDADSVYFREMLRDFMPRMMAAAQRLFESEQVRARSLAEAAWKATSADRPSIERRVALQDEMINRILGAALTLVETLGTLEMPAHDVTEWLKVRLGRQARLAAGRIQMAKVHVKGAEEVADDSPEDTALAAEVSAARKRREVAVESLGTIVDRMKRLDMDTVQYRQLLIASTGEITTDIFDSRVAGHLLSRWLGGMGEGFIENGPSAIFKVFLFSAVAFFFWTLARLVRRFTVRALEVSDLGFSQLLKRMIVSTASSSILILGLLIALSKLGIKVGPMLAGLGIAGFVLGFALQDSLANFAAGIMILAYRPYDVEDLIECAGGVFGTVSAMNLVSTTILTIDDQTRVVPNGKIWGDVITNVSAQKHRRVDLVFGISYEDEISDAEEVLHGILNEHPKVLDQPEAVVKVHELGDSSVNFVVRPWVLREDYWDVHWDVTREVKLRFDRQGISIPYPQQDVHIKTGSTMPGSSDRMEVGNTAATGGTAPEADA